MQPLPDKPELVIFAHLQRTGGNSLRELLAANFGGAATARGTADSIGAYIQRLESGRLRAVEGIFKYGAHQYLSPTREHRYFTFVREPLARWQSYYRFCLVHKPAGLHELAKAHDFIAFLRHERRPRNAAAQVVFGYGAPPDPAGLDDAMQRFAFVGVQERFSDSAFLLSRVFGLRFPFVGVVGRLASGKPEAVDPAAAAALAELDALDLGLHANATRRLDACIAGLDAADADALKAYRAVVGAAAESPELTSLLNQVRAAALPALQSVKLLRGRLGGLQAEFKPWVEQVEQVLRHFESMPAAPALWLEPKARPAAAREARPAGKPSAAAAPSPGVVQLRGDKVALCGGRHARLSVENVPGLPSRATFLEHHRRVTGTPSEVVAGIGDVLWLSDDLGKSWRTLRLRGAPGAVARCFTTRTGWRLIQFHGDGRIHAYDRAGRLTEVSEGPLDPIHWHGAWSVAQSRSRVICWAEYLDRGERVSVHRSEDDGRTWQRSFEIDGRADTEGAIRHFHMVLADPFVPGRWYLSSGDRGRECRFWISDDDAKTWVDAGAPRIVNALAFGLEPHLHPIYRATAAAVGREWIYWSTDDLLGGRGPLFVRMRKESPHDIEVLGRVGTQHTRALVRRGPDTFVAVSQGNAGSDHVAAHLLDGSGSIRELLRLPKPVDRLTSFCRSMSSTFVDQGVFFTAGGGDVLSPGPRLWRWRLQG